MTNEEAIKILKIELEPVDPLFSEVQQALDMAIKALSTENVPQLKQTDTLIIADALRYLVDDTERHKLDRARAEKLREQYLLYGAKMKGGDIE